MEASTVESLRTWFDENARELPWRTSDRDPYRVWVSEVMLQQTRVDTVVPYFHRFLERFPDVAALARAQEEEVLNLWEGLGYYARARRMVKAARKVVDEYQGTFPNSFEELQELPGVGPSTAGAIASFAFQQPEPVLDGNVRRVLSRFYGLGIDPDTTEGERKFSSIARELLETQQEPGMINEALIELGALVCTSSSPSCETCPIRNGCYAYQHDQVNQFPGAQQPTSTSQRTYIGLAPVRQEQILLRKRPSNGLLGGMWEVPMKRMKEGETVEERGTRMREELLGEGGIIEGPFDIIQHTYSHFRLQMPLYTTRVNPEEEPAMSDKRQWFSLETIQEVPVHNASKKALDTLSEVLDL